ncbi:MAG: ATP-binding cassette domain-containing protein, partial [Myxococcota bacterium]
MNMNGRDDGEGVVASTLSVRDLSVSFASEGRRRLVVDRLSLEIPPRMAVGLVGESGCGKSVTGLAVMGLLPPTPHCVVTGEV